MSGAFLTALERDKWKDWEILGKEVTPTLERTRAPLNAKIAYTAKPQKAI